MRFSAKFILPLAASFLVTGCEIPIPSSIGLALVGEIEMSVKDLAGASLFSERCGAAGFESENIPATRAIRQLSSNQRQALDDWQSDPQYRRDIEDSVNQKACADHADEFRSLKSKPIIITG